MTTQHIDKWKSKIDPNFDKVVKAYVILLTQLEASSTEGLLIIPKAFIETTLEQPEFSSVDLFNSDSSYHLFRYTKKIAGMTEDEFILYWDLLNTADEKAPDEVIKICTEMVKSLPEEESRAFYENKLKYFKDNLETAKDKLDFYLLVISLIIRRIYVVLFYEEREVVDDKDSLKESNTTGVVLNSLLSSISQMSHQATLAKLKENIIKGDDKSIFKAVQVDKSFLYLDEVKKRILTAQLSGDIQFLKKLGKAIADPPLQVPALHGKTFAILQFFWPYGLYGLTYEELYNFLIHCGLNPPEYPYAFQKFISRHIKPLYNF